MLVDANGAAIGATPDDAAAIAVQSIAAKAKDVLVALEMVGISVPLPLEIRAGTQVVVIGKDGARLSKVAPPEGKKRGPKANGTTAPAAPAASTPVTPVASVASASGSVFDRRAGAADRVSQEGSASVAQGILAGLAEALPPSFP